MTSGLAPGCGVTEPGRSVYRVEKEFGQRHTVVFLVARSFHLGDLPPGSLALDALLCGCSSVESRATLLWLWRKLSNSRLHVARRLAVWAIQHLNERLLAHC